MSVKKIIATVFAFSLVMSSSAFAEEKNQPAGIPTLEEKLDYTAKVNGVKIKGQIYENKDHAHMMPVREVSEMLGFEVQWNDEEKSCVVRSKDSVVKFHFKQDSYVDNGDMAVELGANAELKNEKTYVPSRFFSHFFGIHMTNEENSVINITSPVNLKLEENKDIAVEKGQLFSVEMETNPTTGYGWELTKDDAVELIKEFKVLQGDERLSSGAPSLQTWIFKADTAGEYTLKFEYKRAWETVAPEKTAEYKVTVK